MNGILNLFEIAEAFKEEMLKDRPEHSKMFGRLASECRDEIKSGKCFYCDESVSSYCNSHSIPASFLKNIAEEGKLFTHAGVIELELSKSESGVNQTGTFYIICRKCDSKIFKDYENKDSYNGEVNQRVLAQIAMKNYLKAIFQRKLEIALHEKMGEDNPINMHVIRNYKLDLNDNIRGFKKAKKVDVKPLQDEYYLFFYEKLDYVVPIAFQHKIALAVDLEGGIINNLYNYKEEYRIQHLHLSVFPLDGTSVVMMFIDKTERRYREFIRQFQNLSLEDQLAAINYIIFLYSEDFYLSPSVKSVVEDDRDLKEVSGRIGATLAVNNNEIDSLKMNYCLSDFKKISNMLSPSYAVSNREDMCD